MLGTVVSQLVPSLHLAAGASAWQSDDLVCESVGKEVRVYASLEVLV